MKAVPPYQQVRREFLKGRIPPSTSIAQQGLLLPGADMNIQAMGIIPGHGFAVEHLKHAQLAGGRPPAIRPPSRSAILFSFPASLRSRSATSRAATASPRRR